MLSVIHGHYRILLRASTCMSNEAYSLDRVFIRLNNLNLTVFSLQQRGINYEVYKL